MKLILQIAAGVVLGWLIIDAIEMLTAAYALKSVAESLPRFPGVSSSQLTSPPRELPPTVIRGAEPQTDGRQWSIKTPNGTTYSGTGRPPGGGLGEVTPSDEQRPVQQER